jgi:hypothetical protein
MSAAEQLKLSSPPEDAASSQYIAVTGQDRLQTWIVLPDAGTVYAAYEYADAPPASIYIWHQGGATQPIQPGVWLPFRVGAGDALVWTLSSPTNMIKVGWMYQA